MWDRLLDVLVTTQQLEELLCTKRKLRCVPEDAKLIQIFLDGEIRLRFYHPKFARVPQHERVPETRRV